MSYVGWNGADTLHFVAAAGATAALMVGFLLVLGRIDYCGVTVSRRGVLGQLQRKLNI